MLDNVYYLKVSMTITCYATVWSNNNDDYVFVSLVVIVEVYKSAGVFGIVCF